MSGPTDPDDHLLGGGHVRALRRYLAQAETARIEGRDDDMRFVYFLLHGYLEAELGAAAAASEEPS